MNAYIVREDWRPVNGYEGLYEVSNLGNVRSVTRTVGNGRTIQGQPIRQFKRAGLPRGKEKRRRVHMEIRELIEQIESLQAENERLAIHGGRYMQLADERYKMFERAIKRAEDAEAQLTASQRREKAAVELIDKIYNDKTGDVGFIMFLINNWRGPQEAGREESEVKE